MKVWAQEIEVRSERRFAALDVTGEVERAVAASGIREGIALIASRHTTAAVVVNEFEPQLMADLERWLEGLAPAGRGWRHDALARNLPGEPENADAHLKAMLLGHSQCVAVAKGRLALGTWQRVILVDCDGPRRRRIEVRVMGSA